MFNSLYTLFTSDKRAMDTQPKDAKQALAEDKYDDCLSCRVTGSAAFMGLGVYSYYTGMANLRKQEKAIMQGPTKYKMGSRKLGIASISATLVGMGCGERLIEYCTLNPY